MKPQDIYKLKYPTEVRVSPDGTRVAYTVISVNKKDNSYDSVIYVASTSGSGRKFTSGKNRDGRPRWSPKGERLAFVSHRGEKGSQPLVMPSDGGEPETIAEFPEEIEELAWSPDGRKIALLVRDQDSSYAKEKDRDRSPRRIDSLVYRLDSVGWTSDRPRHLFVTSSSGAGKPKQLTEGREVAGLAWSPDGKQIAFTSGRHDGWDYDHVSDLFVIGSSGGKPKKLTKTDSFYAMPSWSPDGSEIAFYFNHSPMDSPHHTQVGVMRADGTKRRLLTEDLDRHCAPFFSAREPVWAQDHVYFTVEDSGNTSLYRAQADAKGKPEMVIGGERTVAGVDISSDTLSFIITDPTSLPKVVVLDEPASRATEGAAEKAIGPDVSKAFYAQTSLSKPERFLAKSADGSEVEAWVIRPMGFQKNRKYPALLNIHGGPFTQYGNRFFDEFQVFADAGYVVVYSNPRGSAGYSEAWGRAIRGPKADPPGAGWGSVDYEDLMAVTDEAVKRFNYIDPNRLGVMGGSYGGYMTSWIVGHTQRFKCGISERAVNNMLTMSWTSDLGSYFRSYFGPEYLDDPDEYLRMSPITYVRHISTPLLILHSESDLRCPISQAEELYSALKILGRDVEFVRFPAESHELSRAGAPGHRVQRFELILDYLGRHLKKKAGPGRKAPRKASQARAARSK